MTVGVSETVIWHDVENGSYEADLSLWSELADQAGGPVLEVGCGSGRVALDLGRRGHHVLGVDSEPELVAALNERARDRGIEASAESADVRDMRIEGEFALVIAPMQVVQLLPTADERVAALVRMREHLALRGLIALAIVEGDLGTGAPGLELGRPLPDVREVDGWVYSSLPLELSQRDGCIVVSRLRQVVTPDGDLTEERADLALSILDLEAVSAEAARAGLRVAGTRGIGSTTDHVGSLVVLLEAAG
jgi:SAM-dependent methyltransferase